MIKFSPILCVSFVILLLAIPTIGKSVDCLWFGGAGDWGDPLNWDCGVVPGIGDKAFVTSGTVVLDIIGGVVVDELVFTGGDISGGATPDLIVKTSLVWEGGAFLCLVLIDAGASLAMTTPFPKTIGPGASVTVTTTATADWSAGLFVIDGILDNAGVFAITFDGMIDTPMGVGEIFNSGAIVKESSSGVTKIFPKLISSGSVDVIAGRLELHGVLTNSGALAPSMGDTLVLIGDATLSMGTIFGDVGQIIFSAGIHLLETPVMCLNHLVFESGSTTVDDDLICDGAVDLLGGIISGMGSLIITSDFDWEGGILDLPTVVDGTGTLDVFASTAKILSSTLVADGISSIADGSMLEINSPGMIDNGGTLTLLAGVDIGSTGTPGLILNSGRLIKASTSTSSLSMDFTNAGLLIGIGSLEFLGTFTNLGVTSPGSSPGLLNFVGSFANGTRLNMEVEDDMGPGLGHDQLTATGGVLLKDTLNLAETGSVPLGTYTLIKCSGVSPCISGTFDEIFLPTDYSLTYHDDSVTVEKSSAVPVELLSFIGKREQSAIALSWQTATEINNAAFTIERSYDATQFNAIGTMLGTGTSYQLQQYDFQDRQINTRLVSKAIYYRLLQIDYDGTINYSPIIAVPYLTEEAQGLIKLIPTSSPHQVRLFFQNFMGEKAQLSVFDVNGKQFHQQEVELSSAEEELELSMEGLHEGVYFIRVIIGHRFQHIETWWVPE